MIRVSSRCLAAALAFVLLLDPIAQAGAAPGANVFQEQLNQLTAVLDRGTVLPEQAIKDFTEAVEKSGVSVDDIDTYLRGQLSHREYAELKRTMRAQTRGIDPEALTADERAEIAAVAWAATRSDGLAWGPCGATRVALGVGAIAAVALVFYLLLRTDQIEVINDWAHQEGERVRAEIADRIDAATSPGEIEELKKEQARLLDDIYWEAKGRRSGIYGLYSISIVGGAAGGFLAYELLTTDCR